MSDNSTKFEWALSPKSRKPIHISELELTDRGARGYQCIGCGQDMEACMGEIVKHYFRHSATQKEIGKCTWSDEKTRRKLFHDLLQIYKKIKLPALYFSDTDSIGKRTKAVEEGVQAFSEVRFGMAIVSTNKGIEIIRRPEVNEEMSVLAYPDAVLFDNNQNILLCIHDKYSIKPAQMEELKARYMYADLDALYIRIPVVSRPEELEKLITTTEHSNWIYHTHEQKYTHPSTPDPKGRLPTKNNPGIFSTEESYQCRVFQINEAIRAVNRLMGTADFEELLREEKESTAGVEHLIQGAESDLEGLRKRLGELERTENKIAFKEAGRRLAEIQSKDRAGGSSDQRAVEKRYRELEKRYLGRRGELTAETESAINSAVRTRREIDRIEEEGYRFSRNWEELEELRTAQGRTKEDVEYFARFKEKLSRRTAEFQQNGEGIKQTIRNLEEETRKVERVRGKLSEAQEQFLSKKYNRRK